MSDVMLNHDDARRLLKAAHVLFEGDDTVLNMNDTFGWAVAFGQKVEDADLTVVAALFSRYGFCGLVYWVSERNDHMRSEFKDINRFIDFVRREEEQIAREPDSSERAYMDLPVVEDAAAAQRERDAEALEKWAETLDNAMVRRALLDGASIIRAQKN